MRTVLRLALAAFILSVSPGANAQDLKTDTLALLKKLNGAVYLVTDSCYGDNACGYVELNTDRFYNWHAWAPINPIRPSEQPIMGGPVVPCTFAIEGRKLVNKTDSNFCHAGHRQRWFEISPDGSLMYDFNETSETKPTTYRRIR